MIESASPVEVAIISFALSTVNKSYGNSAFTNVLTNTGDGTVTYSSSNTSVATVNSSGQVTIVGAGNTTITATVTDGPTSHYEVTTVSYSLNVAKANPTYTAPSAKSLTYNGSSQALLNAGSTSHGTIQYSSDGSSWSTTIPSQTNAGSYTCYWRLIGDSNHTDVSSTSISTTIAKANRTVSFSSPTTSVNVGSTATNTATVSAGSSDGTLTYSSSNTSYATVNSSGVVTGVATGSVTITASITGGTNYNDASGSYSLTVAQAQPTVQNFSYTGAVQSVTLQPGTYKLECWGAQGGSIDGADGGKGGYSVGTLTINSATLAYIYVGGKGLNASGTGAKAGGFNGGGNSYGTTTNYYGGSGGGASDIRIGTDSLSSRVIVAGGGGGAGRYNSTNKLQGGYGGGTTGGTGGQSSDTSAKPGEGGTQSRGGYSYDGTSRNNTSSGTIADLGVGGGAISGNTSKRIVGGGGGYYGGGYGMRSGAGGGSGYVGNLASAETKAGNTSFPSTSGGTETGHSGNGYARITKL